MHGAFAFIGWFLHRIALPTNIVLSNGLAVKEDFSNTRNEKSWKDTGLVWSARLCTDRLEWDDISKVREYNVGFGEESRRLPTRFTVHLVRLILRCHGRNSDRLRILSTASVHNPESQIEYNKWEHQRRGWLES